MELVDTLGSILGIIITPTDSFAYSLGARLQFRFGSGYRGVRKLECEQQLMRLRKRMTNALSLLLCRRRLFVVVAAVVIVGHQIRACKSHLHSTDQPIDRSIDRPPALLFPSSFCIVGSSRSKKKKWKKINKTRGPQFALNQTRSGTTGPNEHSIHLQRHSRIPGELGRSRWQYQIMHLPTQTVVLFVWACFTSPLQSGNDKHLRIVQLQAVDLLLPYSNSSLPASKKEKHVPFFF